MGRAKADRRIARLVRRGVRARLAHRHLEEMPMQRAMHTVPGMLVAFAGLGLLAWGPIAQLAHYHEFADQRSAWGIPHAIDVLTNIAFAVVGAWALWGARAVQPAPEARARAVFFVSLLLTAAGSGWYHWAPDNARLVFDRIPIALAC